MKKLKSAKRVRRFFPCNHIMSILTIIGEFCHTLVFIFSLRTLNIYAVPVYYVFVKMPHSIPFFSENSRKCHFMVTVFVCRIFVIEFSSASDNKTHLLYRFLTSSCYYFIFNLHWAVVVVSFDFFLLQQLSCFCLFLLLLAEVLVWTIR